MTKDLKNYKFYEKKIISSYDRFGLSKNQYDEIRKDLKGAKILIIGAAGSIGKEFTVRIMDFDFRNLYLMDKDENQLTDLNRDLVRDYRKKIKKINFICADLNIFNLFSRFFDILIIWKLIYKNFTSTFYYFIRKRII